MKKESLITSIVFFGVGFLAGYVYDAQKSANLRRSNPVVAGSLVLGGASLEKGADQIESPAGKSLVLPAGHPPIDVAATIRFLEDEAAQNPRDPGPRLKLANLFYDRRQFRQAVAWYDQTLAIDPTNVDARTDLGTSYFNLGRPQDAIREFRRSLEIDPKHEATLFNMIVVCLEGTHDLAAAQEAWDRLHKLNPTHPGLDRLKQSLDAARGATGVPEQRAEGGRQ